MFEISENQEDVFQDGAQIKVIGVGGGGCNAVNTMIKAGLNGIEYIVANTDSQALGASLAPTKVQLGAEITKGLGAGANPEIGRKAALDEYEKLSEVLDGADMVFITAGMGGGTGTGASPVIAKLCKELGALTVGVVTRPFVFEGKKRSRQADRGIESLEEGVDSLITIPNQRLLHIAGEGLTLIDTFKKADQVLLNAVRGISDLINNTGHINADFADVSTVMANKGLSLMGTGIASGSERATQAAMEAISSPLLEDITIDGATGIIINITGNESLTMHETNEAVTLIMDAADDDAEIIFGTVVDDSLEDEIKVTVIATGLGGQDRVSVTGMKNEAGASSKKAETLPLQNITEKEQPLEMGPENDPADKNLDEVEEEVPQEKSQEELSSQAPIPAGLADTIRKAAGRYESIKKPDESVSDLSLASTPVSRPSASKAKPDAAQASRARTVAQRLGFISFDEDELDTPTFLRKEQSTEEKTDHEQTYE